MEMVTEFLVSKLMETLFDMAGEELARELELPDDVKKLQDNLEKLQCYLQDAEKKSIEDASTNRWLNKIKVVVYDIEDLLEDYNTLKVDNSESSVSGGNESSFSFTRVSCHFPNLSCLKITASKHRIAVEIQNLNKRLEDEIMNEIPNLGLMRSLPTSRPVTNQITQTQLTAHMTASGLIRSDIVGNNIHDDARSLIESLTKEDYRDNPLVYAIVGMGGIGKTTLAKLIFDDQVIKDRFEVKSWILVSQNYDEIDIMKSIIKSAGGNEKHCDNLNLLSEKVKNSVEGKRLFMVLDDVWETERVWKGVLSSLLRSGVAEGSRVLITTRNEEVARQMMAVQSHQVQPLSLEDGWSLLCKSAFPAWEQQEAKDDAWNLKDIGIELVKKCDGLPLAIDIIGGMLSAENRTREAWEFVLKSSVWEVNGLPKEIHSALYLSYQQLPTYIKQCFLYLSIHPNCRYFTGKIVEETWIQSGFIRDGTGISSHDLAESYLWMLVRRNLLKSHNPYYFFEGSFTMHDLVRSLCRFLKQNEILVATDEKEILDCSGRTKKLRHLSFMGRGDKTIKILPKCVREQKSLRTLMIYDKSICKIDYDLFNRLRHLRILWLQGTKVTKLPKSLGALKQLRYLNLSQTEIRELPKTIQKLKNLRTLNVTWCERLCNLPSCIMKLHRICTLYTMGSALDHLPPGLGRLNKVRFLDFVMPLEDIAQKSSTLKDLGTLTELRALRLYKLERVLDRSQATHAALKDKQHLRTLHLCSKSDYKDDSTSSAQVIEVNKITEEIFEELCPPPQLHHLGIYAYSGSKLPSWLGDAKFKSLLSLAINGCSNCEQLDGLGLLASLESLEIVSASSIKSIGSEFYTGKSKTNTEKGVVEAAHQNVVYFPRIKILKLRKMNDLEEWSGLGKAIHAMPHLETLQIYGCPKLKSFPEELLEHAAASLKNIIIGDSCKLQLKVVQNLPCLKILKIENIPHLQRISELPALQELQIKNCPEIKFVEIRHHLQTIFWIDSNTDTLPGWFSNELKATCLKISCKEELVRKICSNKENEDHEWSKIQHFDDIAIWDEDGCLRATYTKNTKSFSMYPGKTEGELEGELEGVLERESEVESEVESEGELLV